MNWAVLPQRLVLLAPGDAPGARWCPRRAGAHRVNRGPRAPRILGPPTFRHWMEAVAWCRWGDVAPPRPTFPLAGPAPLRDPPPRAPQSRYLLHHSCGQKRLQSGTWVSLRASQKPECGAQNVEAIIMFLKAALLRPPAGRPTCNMTPSAMLQGALCLQICFFVWIWKIKRHTASEICMWVCTRPFIESIWKL